MPLSKMKTQSWGQGINIIRLRGAPHPPRHGRLKDRKDDYWEPERQDALKDYRSNRENGSSADNPSRAFPRDGADTFEKGRGKDKNGEARNPEWWYVTYTEGPGDKQWMEEKDRNYLARINGKGEASTPKPVERKNTPPEIRRMRQEMEVMKRSQQVEQEKREKLEREKAEADRKRQEAEKQKATAERKSEEAEKQQTALQEKLEKSRQENQSIKQENQSLHQKNTAQKQQFESLLTQKNNEVDQLKQKIISLQKQPTSPGDWQSQLSHLMIAPKDLHIGSRIGGGKFGEVHEASWRYTKVAVKEIKGDYSAAALKEFRREAALTMQLNSPQVVRFFGISEQPPIYRIVMEYVPKGSLYSVLRSEEEKEEKQKESISWKQRYQIGLDIACGLHFMHQHKPQILHRDLKSLNVLITNDYRAKLADFGLSKIKSETISQSSLAAEKDKQSGSPAWMAPEQLMPTGKVTTSTDIYSLGMVLWELASQKTPFDNAPSIPVLMGWIIMGLHPEMPTKVHPLYQQLIEKCWSTKPEDRPSTDYLIASLSKLLVDANKAEPKAKSNFLQSENPAEEEVMSLGSSS